MESLVPTTLNVERLTQNGPITSTIEVDLPLDLPFADLAPRIRPHVDLASDEIIVNLVSKISPVVTDGPSNYSPAASGGLKVNIEEPLASWYKAYRRTVGLAPQERSSSESEVKSSWTRAFKKDGPMVDWQDFSITVGAATFRFNRTLRVPDDATNYALPPGLGTFPLAKAQDFSSTLPEYIVQRGGYIMPLFQREAMWIGISGGTCAIKVSVGGINAISGYQQTGGSETGIQDYVVGGKQPWLDGIATEPGVVRQFVAMKLGQGYTIEEQLSNTAHGGIQIDVFPPLLKVVFFYRESEPEHRLDLNNGPRSLNIPSGETLFMTSTQINSPETLRDVVRIATPNPVLHVSYRELPPSPAPDSSSMRISVINLSKGLFHCIVKNSDTIGYIKVLIETMSGIPPTAQRLIFDGKVLDDGMALADYDVQKEDQLHLTLLRDMKIFIKSASEKTFSILVDMSDTIDIVMLKIQDVNGCRPSEQSLWFDREYLREGRTINEYNIVEGCTLELRPSLRGLGHPTLPDPRMGIAAGGKIVQKIYRDTNSPLVYDEDDVSRVFIHAVSTAAWEMITGVVCPLTSITPALYKAHDYPWFALYDEHLSTVQPSGRFDNIQSVLKMDYVASNEPINPEFPPDCAHHMGRTSTCIARPCGHPACVECFGAAIFSGWKCPECSSKISQHVGFDRPVPKVSNSGDNSKGSWWEAENQIQGVSRGNGKVVTLMLEEDRISGLHASDSLGQ